MSGLPDELVEALRAALNSASIAKLERHGSIQLTLFDERDLVSITHPDYPDERLVVCRRNPELAKRRARKREALLQATEKLLAEIINKVERKNKPLRGKDAIGLEAGKIIDKKRGRNTSPLPSKTTPSPLNATGKRSVPKPPSTGSTSFAAASTKSV